MVDGTFVCFGLEDEYREEKVSKETRIPAGTYRVTLRTEGTHHSKYLKRYPDFHKGMLHIKDVPNFKWILIHCGNTDEDTAGCLLVGSNISTEPGDMQITSSRAAYKRFYPMVVDAAANETLSITFLDNDRTQRDKNTINNHSEEGEMSNNINSSMTEEEKDKLFENNVQEINKMNIAAGSMVKGLIMALDDKNRNTYIKLRDAVSNGHIVSYDFVAGNSQLVFDAANSQGFKKVTENLLEVPGG
jgi:hypothetical protein